MILVFKMISIPFRVDTEDLAEKFKYLIFFKKTPFFPENRYLMSKEAVI